MFSSECTVILAHIGHRRSFPNMGDRLVGPPKTHGSENTSNSDSFERSHARLAPTSLYVLYRYYEETKTEARAGKTHYTLISRGKFSVLLFVE